MLLPTVKGQNCPSMSVQDVGATPRPCAAARGNFPRQTALWQHLTGIGFSGKSATAACREGYWGWSGVCSLDCVCRTIEPEALKQGNMSSLGFTSKEQRNLGLLVHLMTSNPKILYAPVGTEVDKVILKVRASAHEGAESRTLLLPLPLAQSTRDIHAQRSSGGLGGWS